MLVRGSRPLLALRAAGPSAGAGGAAAAARRPSRMPAGRASGQGAAELPVLEARPAAARAAKRAPRPRAAETAAQPPAAPAARRAEATRARARRFERATLGAFPDSLGGAPHPCTSPVVDEASPTALSIAARRAGARRPRGRRRAVRAREPRQVLAQALAHSGPRPRHALTRDERHAGLDRARLFSYSLPATKSFAGRRRHSNALCPERR